MSISKTSIKGAACPDDGVVEVDVKSQFVSVINGRRKGHAVDVPAVSEVAHAGRVALVEHHYVLPRPTRVAHGLHVGPAVRRYLIRIKASGWFDFDAHFQKNWVVPPHGPVCWGGWVSPFNAHAI